MPYFVVSPYFTKPVAGSSSFQATIAESEAPPVEFENREMRALNHEHVFVVPLAESNGLDLDFMMKNPEEGAAVGDGLGRLLERILVFPMVTVAALNGHAFAGGGILAMAHDYRIMREDRGWFCLPEVDIKIPFSQAMAQMIRARLPADTARDAMLSGRRYSAAEAVAGGIAGRAVPEAEVVPTAVALAQPLAEKDRTTMGAIKKAMFADVLPYFEKHRGGS